MRDKERIKPFCNRLAVLWSIVPDWRFGQLISNILVGRTDTHLFYVQDDQLLEQIQSYFKRASK